MHNIESHFLDLINAIIKKKVFPSVSKHIDINEYKIKIKNLPDNFVGFKILHISDLHGTNFLSHYPQFKTKIATEKPDILVISGDISHDGYYQRTIDFIDQISSIVPYQKIFVVTGNHEFLTCKHHHAINITEVSFELAKRKVNFLRNQVINYKIDKQKISIIGIDDPWSCHKEADYVDWHLKTLCENIPKDRPKLLISHRPEYIKTYQKNNIDLVFSGHTHGGQIFIPIINRGLYIPGQGFFGRLAKGYYHYKNTQMIISAGIGNETRMPRINNPGDINFITLKS